jgi:hypothetical protein
MARNSLKPCLPQESNDRRRARANAAVGARARAVPGCAPPWWKRGRPPRAAKTPTSLRSIGVSPHVGVPNAAVAVAHSLLVMMYALLTQQQTYRELGSQYFDARDRESVQRRLIHRLEALGYTVSLQPTATPAA